MLSWRSVCAQGIEVKASDSVYVIMPMMVWENRSSQAYFAIPDTLARRALVKMMAKDTLSYLYVEEVGKVMALREELEEERRHRFYERVLMGCLILILLLK